jgi:hypothetical protein
MNVDASEAFSGILAKCVFTSQTTEDTKYDCLYQTMKMYYNVEIN